MLSKYFTAMEDVKSYFYNHFIYIKVTKLYVMDPILRRGHMDTNMKKSTNDFGLILSQKAETKDQLTNITVCSLLMNMMTQFAEG